MALSALREKVAWRHTDFRWEMNARRDGVTSGCPGRAGVSYGECRQGGAEQVTAGCMGTGQLSGGGRRFLSSGALRIKRSGCLSVSRRSRCADR